MASLDGIFRDLASNLLAGFGGTVVLRPRARSFAPSTGAVTDANTDSDAVSVNAVLQPYSTRLVDGERVQTGDLACLVAAKDVEAAPVAGDLVYLGSLTGEKLVVVGVVTQRSPEAEIVYELQLRR
jgi:hypothetical protein